MEQVNIRSRFIIIAVITGLLVWSFLAWDIKLGQDLEGGTTLRFSLDIDGAVDAGRLDPMNPTEREKFVDSVIQVIEKRINAHGVAEITLTPVGDNKFEISLPTGMETESIEEVVTTLGNLQFRIEVLPQYNFDADDKPKRTRVWTKTEAEFDTFKQAEFQNWKDAKAKGLQYKSKDPRFYIVKNAKYPGTEVGHFHVLELPTQKNFRFDGSMLKNPAVGQDQFGKAVVTFDVKGKYQNEFGQWTDQNISLPMAIVLNEEYDTAPRINSKLTDSVQITLGETNFEEAEKKARALATVLETGSLKIRPKRESRTTMGASLAGQSRDRGVLAVIVAFGLVLIFMMIYYRGAGIVANIALLLNLVLLVGFLAFFQAVLTLPGIAGIVLTVGMAVDANILINERIREERRAGRTLRRALSEGYARALSAIIDANVTSVITAIFLYTYGSGTIKGFAVTLGIGLMVSMFTAIYVTRTIFEWRLRNGGLQKLGTYGAKTIPTVSWLGMRRLFAPISVIAVVIGLSVFAMTDRYTLYDVDFTGGYKLRIQTKDPVTVDEVKERLSTQVRTVQVSEEVETSEGFELKQFSDEIGPFKDAQVLEATGDTGRPGIEITVQRLFEGDDKDTSESVQALQFEQYVREIFDGELLPNWLLKEPVAFKSTGPDDPMAGMDDALLFAIAFDDPDDVLIATDLQALLQTKFPYFTYQGSTRIRNEPALIQGLQRSVEVRDAASPAEGIKAFDVWFKSRQDDGNSLEISDRLMKNMGEYMGSKGFRTHLTEQLGEGAPNVGNLGLSKPFPSQDQVGSAPAERAKNNAILALLLSLIGIIIYIAIRFNSRSMGFAAVLCLFHDVAICLGLVALANTIGLIDAKINLAMVAAFLTLVGYSVNDTVVIFDRIRENRGKNPKITADVIDFSINQTLARTIRTSLTFLIVCVTLFALNFGQRNVLEGFAFLLILGSIVGTYSTIAIASPLLLYLPWLWQRLKKFAPDNSIVSKCAQSAALLIVLPLAAIVWAAWALAFSAYALVTGLVLFPVWALTESLPGEGRSEVAPAR